MSPRPRLTSVAICGRAVCALGAFLAPWPRPPAVAVEFELVDQVAPRVADTEPAERPKTGGMFLQTSSGTLLWQQTLAAVAADWPVVRTIEPVFDAVPPREGLIESAWIEPAEQPHRARGLPAAAGSPRAR